VKTFTKQQISGKHFLVLDIGKYKLRVVAITIKNKKIEILEYGEKRQDSSIFL